MTPYHIGYRASKGQVAKFFEILHFVRSALLGSYKTGKNSLEIIEKSPCNSEKIGYNTQSEVRGQITENRGQKAEGGKENEEKNTE